MTQYLTRRIASVALAATLATTALTGCGGDLPGERTETSAEKSVVGLMENADENGVVLRTPDGTRRTFKVRDEDAKALDLKHLDSHAGFTDVGFRVYYRSEGGVDYAVAAEETKPPAAQ
jgi:hypothetical protein